LEGGEALAAIEVSIIVPCRGRAQLLQSCLESLFSQITHVHYEVIAVYCKLDQEVDNVVKMFGQVRAITSDEYLLPGVSRNLGAEHAEAEILGFIDSDCIVDSKWVEIAKETINNGAVLCSGAIKDALPWNMISSVDNRLQYADFPVGRPYGKSLYFSGAHLAVGKKIFQDLGGFPPHLHGQDVIFTQKVVEQYGEYVIFNPKMMVSHHGRTGWREFLSHHEKFGISRAQDRIQMNKTLSWLAERRYLSWIIFLRRLIYISLRVVQWNLRDIFRYGIQLPVLFCGLYYWVYGFVNEYNRKDRM
jgi:glycosyltransferase involved in cell wall biosynthesis